MPLFTRYILKELISVFLATLAVMTLLIVFVLLILQGMRFGLGLGQFLRIVPYLLPQALVIAIPATLLFAAASVYGRMSGSNEVIAIKSLGISPWTLFWPALWLAVVLSLTCVWLNDVAVSWGRQGAKRVVLESFEDIAYRMLATQHAYRAEKFSIAVMDVQGKTLVYPELEVEGLGDSGKAKIEAASAVILADPAAGTITIKLKDMRLQAGEFSYSNVADEELVLSLEAGAKSDISEERPSEMPLSIIPSKVKELKLHREELKRTQAIRAAYRLLTGDFSNLAAQEWAQGERLIVYATNQLARLQTESPRRWANGFSCLCFVMVGVPVAIRLKNSDFLASFFVCFLPILVVYYPLLMLGVDQAKNGGLPTAAVWLANAIAALAGYWQLRVVERY